MPYKDFREEGTESHWPSFIFVIIPAESGIVIPRENSGKVSISRLRR
jgi:hypothetical protein